jgi:ABC-2 type transport system ATP-binding protein
MNASASRYQELQHLLAARDLSLLSRRLLDYSADLSPGPEIRRRAIALRAGYNAYAAREQALQTPEAAQLLLDEAAAVLAALPQPPAVHPALPPDPVPPALPPVFQGTGITKVYKRRSGGFTLPPLDVTLRRGEITGIVGANGNGKTTLLRIIAGDLAATGGDLRYPGLRVPSTDWYRIKQQIGYIPQQLAPWSGLLKDNLHFTAAIQGVLGNENEDLVEFVIHRLGLSQYQDAGWGQISGGYRLRFELARALVRQPELLIIDEPLANLDINAQQIFLQDLRFLADSERHPVAILLSSQHLHELESISDNLIFIKNGEALFNGRRTDFARDRDRNLFECGTSLTLSELTARLGHLPGIEIRPAGPVMVIAAPVELDAQALLAELVRAQVPLRYFRDISDSTVRLFRDL